ncbi:WecB/TagA/CpsF family glycosyltransferase [Methylobacterium sp. NEAU K]|uniref:WecB/TagA/CpsF family glycosyltransferase n=1 Tax=Methylobacterium sp. NEAU K TaxID=3064946 RepID=UPI0027328939|nr:WecB/TagA/CpsF family glycosyltransferase [Methylobacterium sp. NEAU K]MDP4006134.1 WecB/TagA/CpsF family glycosyltransferase [Methylobacterium sp. NEAU K]
MSLTVNPAPWNLVAGEAAGCGATGRIPFLDLHFDRLTQPEAVAALLAAGASESFRYLVTPNVDHMLRVAADPAVAQIYREAWLCLNDSRILNLLAATIGIDLPATPGSDLVAALLAHPDLDRSAPILIVGGGAGLAEAVAGRCGLTRVAQVRPPMGLRQNPAALAETVAAIEAAEARFVFLAVGSPQQEMIAAALARGGRARGAGLCIGAGLEFLVGARRRAPAPLRAAGLEWLFRLACEPGRLGRRYLVDGPRILRVFWDYARASRDG